ncbi:MAG: hypothetical protein FJ194_16370, partial [Gammaproteobacteria bacterium]|nr:hypothetical protein [Gammaproteobacteria bacterium]
MKHRLFFRRLALPGLAPCLVGALLVAVPITGSYAAAVTVLLNSSPAHECFLEVERDRMNPDFEPC